MPKRSVSDWVMEALALAALISIFLFVTLHWADIPARVPIHFGISGKPDAWNKKNTILFVPCVAIGMYLVMTLASRYQRLINIPMTIDRDAPEVRRILQSMAITLKMVILFLFGYIVWAQVSTALGFSSGLGVLFLPVFLIATLIPLGLYLKKLRAYRK